MHKVTLTFLSLLVLSPLVASACTYDADFIGGKDCTTDSDDCTLLLDGNLATYWNAQVTGNPHWVRIDTGTSSEKYPAKFRIAPYAESGHAWIKDFTIEGSNDGSNFYQLYEGTVTDTSDPAVFQDFEFTASTTGYRYFKINTLIPNWNGNNYSVAAEAQMMECSGGGGSTSTASSSQLSAGDSLLTYLFFIADAVWFLAVAAGTIVGLKFLGIA